MGRDHNRNETLDLFSSAADPSLKGASQAVARRSSRRAVLPKNLRKAIRYLADEELDWLLRAAIQEAKRREQTYACECCTSDKHACRFVYAHC